MAQSNLTLKSAIKRTLQLVHELDITVAESSGNATLLTDRLDGLLASLGELFDQKQAANFDIPVDLIKFVDEGGSPDVFLGGVARTALSDNQAAAGKALALGNFCDEILKEAAAVFPEDTSRYEALIGAAPEEARSQLTTEQSVTTTIPTSAAAATTPAPPVPEQL